MELDIDMACVYEPQQFVKSTLPALQATVDQYRVHQPPSPERSHNLPSDNEQASRSLLRRLLRENEQLARWVREFHYATNSATRLHDTATLANCAHARDLLSEARNLWRGTCRSPEGRLAFLRAAAGEGVTPSDLRNTALWAVHGRVPTSGSAGLFMRVAFAVPRWIGRDDRDHFVVVVPYWFPSSPATRYVITQNYPQLHALFPDTSEAVADTFAALWDPRDKESVYHKPEAAYAAAAALATPSLATT